MDQSKLFKGNIQPELYDKMFVELEVMRKNHPAYRDDQLLMYMLCRLTESKQLDAMISEGKRPVPLAIKTGFYKSVYAVLTTRHLAQLNNWDRWDFKILAPMSLDDEARIAVHLKNQDGTRQEVVLAL